MKKVLTKISSWKIDEETPFRLKMIKSVKALGKIGIGAIAEKKAWASHPPPSPCHYSTPQGLL